MADCNPKILAYRFIYSANMIGGGLDAFFFYLMNGIKGLASDGEFS